jgi:hypothetical protein
MAALLLILVLLCALFVGGVGYRRIGMPAMAPAVAMLLLLIGLALSGKL